MGVTGSPFACLRKGQIVQDTDPLTGKALVHRLAKDPACRRAALIALAMSLAFLALAAHELTAALPGTAIGLALIRRLCRRRKHEGPEDTGNA